MSPTAIQPSPRAASSRPARLLAVCEAQIPSAVLGIHAVLGHLAHGPGLCEQRIASSVDLDPGDVAWADAVVLVRGASPAERRLLVEAQRTGRLVATYMDDDLEHVPADARSGYFFGSPVVRDNVAFVVRQADAVLCCSERLAAELERRHGRATTLLRQPRPPRLPEEEQPRGAAGGGAGSPPGAGWPPRAGTAARVRIGFLGGVDHSAFLEELLAAPLERLHRERPGAFDLLFCGALPAFAKRLEARCAPFESDFTAWRRASLGLDIAIGLAPLPDTLFHRCKYFNKYLEYGSLGIAGIYSSVPPNLDAVRDGDTGLLRPNHPDAWYAALRELLDDPARRQRIGRAARADVEARFSEAALEGHWRAALAPLLAHRAPPLEPRALRLPRGRLRHALDRLAVYGPRRFSERLLGRLTGRLRPG